MSHERKCVVVLPGRTVTICCLKDDIGGGKNNLHKGCVVEHKYKLVQGQQQKTGEAVECSKNTSQVNIRR